MPITATPLFTLYVGNRDFVPFSEDAERHILAIVA